MSVTARNGVNAGIENQTGVHIVRHVKENLVVQFSIISFGIMVFLVVVISVMLSARLDLVADLLRGHEAMMMAGAMIRDSDPSSIPSLTRNVHDNRWMAIGMIVSAALFLYASLVSIVRRGWGTINRQQVDLTETTENLNVLQEINLTTLNSPDLQTALEGILDKVLAVSSLDLGVIHLTNAEGDKLEPVASRGYKDPENLRRHRRSLKEAAGRTFSQAVRTNEVAVVENLAASDGMRTLKREGVQSAVLVPVLAREHVLGMMELGSRTLRTFLPREIQLLSAIGAHMGLAVQKAQLHEGTERAYGELQQTEQTLRESGELHRAVVENSADAISISVGTTRVYVNKALLTIHGLKHESQALGYPLDQFMIPADREQAAEAALARQQGRLGHGLFERRIQRPDGEIRTLEVSATTVTFKGQAASLALYRDVTERQRLQAQLVYQADHDSLTSLFNRRRFQEELERELALAQRHGNQGALLFMDLDDFKGINDSFGHGAGDAALVNLAGVLQRHLRGTDVVARMGGDESAVVLPNTNSAQARATAARILTAIQQQSVVVNGRSIPTCASIGIAIFPEAGATVDEVLSQADLAMYRAKATGSNSYQLCDSHEEREASPVSLS